MTKKILDRPPEEEGVDDERCNRLMKILMESIGAFYGEEVGYNAADGKPFVNATEMFAVLGGLGGTLLMICPTDKKGQMFEYLVRTIGVNSSIDVTPFETTKSPMH